MIPVFLLYSYPDGTLENSDVLSGLFSSQILPNPKFSKLLSANFNLHLGRSLDSSQSEYIFHEFRAAHITHSTGNQNFRRTTKLLSLREGCNSPLDCPVRSRCRCGRPRQMLAADLISKGQLNSVTNPPMAVLKVTVVGKWCDVTFRVSMVDDVLFGMNHTVIPATGYRKAQLPFSDAQFA